MWRPRRPLLFFPSTRDSVALPIRNSRPEVSACHTRALQTSPNTPNDGLAVEVLRVTLELGSFLRLMISNFLDSSGHSRLNTKYSLFMPVFIPAKRQNFSFPQCISLSPNKSSLHYISPALVLRRQHPIVPSLTSRVFSSTQPGYSLLLQEEVALQVSLTPHHCEISRHTRAFMPGHLKSAWSFTQVSAERGACLGTLVSSSLFLIRRPLRVAQQSVQPFRLVPRRSLGLTVLSLPVLSIFLIL